MDTHAEVAEPGSALEATTLRDAGVRAQVLATLQDLGREGESFDGERLRRLIEAEEHFSNLVAGEQVEFLRQPSTLPEAEREFALGVQRAWLEAANAFQRFLRNRAAWAATPEGREALPRVTGLAVNAIHGFMKWSGHVNDPARATPWRQLHALYLIADGEGFAQVPFVLHASQPAFRPTVLSLYLRALLVDLLNAGNLTRLQVEIADGWFAAWCADYSLDLEYSSRHHLFYVDVASQAGMRLLRRDAHGTGLRYVRADALKAQIEDVQAGLRRGQLFAGHGAGAAFPVEAHVSLLAVIEKLHRSVQAGSGNRIEERTQFDDREIDVTVGFDRILRRIRGASGEAPAAAAGGPGPDPQLTETIEISPAGLTLVPPDAPAAGAGSDEGADPEVERWRVHDVSSRGFGLIVDRGAADTVLLNGLIGIRNAETGAWLVGSVVRKLPSRVRGDVLVGVEVLSRRPIAVELRHARRSEEATALYLPGPDTNGRLDAVIVRASDFGADNVYDIDAGTARYRVNLNRILRKGADWITARFEILGKA